MHDLTIEREIVIDAPPDVVWRTITEPDQITQWFADEVDLEVRPAASGTFTFDDKANARRVTAPILVEALDAPKRFAFRWSHDDGTTPDDTNSVLVEFTLVADGDERTRLRVTETGLHGVAWPEARKNAYVDDHRHGWEVHLGRLQQRYASNAGQSPR